MTPVPTIFARPEAPDWRAEGREMRFGVADVLVLAVAGLVLLVGITVLLGNERRATQLQAAAAGALGIPLAEAAVGLAPDLRVPGAPPGPDVPPVPVPLVASARLRLETLDAEPLLDVVPFDERGLPRPEAFAQINHAMRARNGHEVDIDPRLVEKLIQLSLAFDGQPLALVSGHRVPGRGTKKTSYHVRGMAADVLIRGVKVHELRKAAKRLGVRGIGVYPTFVHVDVRDDRPPYRWVGGSGRAWVQARHRARRRRR